MSNKRECTTCEGDGYDRYRDLIDPDVPCPECGGKGYIEEVNDESETSN